MRVLYNLAFIIFGIVYIPYLIVTKRYRYGLGNKLGFLSERIKSISSRGKVIWIHAVSIGETKAASILAPLLRKEFPSHTLLFSTVTHTGNKVARTIATGDEEVFYLPFDLSFIADKVVGTIKPELFLCLETELWPNLISSLHRANAKIVLTNGRISNKSYSGYQKIKFVIRKVLSKFSLILMQSERDAEKILSLGAPKDKVSVVGNLKFDLSLSETFSKRREIREKLKIDDREILLIAGSTHKGEEEQILDCYLKLKKEYGNLRLLIAPRHIERAQEVERLLARCGLKPRRFSQIGPSDERLAASDIFILDTIGNLRTIYSASDIVFVGGSLVKKGGQNPIEPASLAKPIIFGKFTSNFQDVVKSFLEDSAAIQVENKEELESAIKSLIVNPKERKKLGLEAKETVSRNSGSSQRTVSLIRKII